MSAEMNINVPWDADARSKWWTYAELNRFMHSKVACGDTDVESNWNNLPHGTKTLFLQYPTGEM